MFDLLRQLWKEEIMVEDVVLQHNAKLELDKLTTNKLTYKWMGPYHVRRAIPEKGTYELEEFDGTPILGMHPGNCLKKFIWHEGFYEPVGQQTFEEDDDDKQGEEERENLALEDPSSQPEPQSKNFKIVPLQLTTEQRCQYVCYEEDDDGNLL